MMSEEKKNLNIIIDTSGSMVESGKRLIARGIVRQIEQYIHLGYSSMNLQLFSANDKITPIEWNTSEEYPEMLFNCFGSFNPIGLLDFIKLEDALSLIVSDCSWTGKTKWKFLHKLNDLPNDVLRIIKVGAEQTTSIKSVKVFESEDILLALEGWIGTLVI